MNPTASASNWKERAAVVLFVALLVLPRLFFSSDEYVAWPQFVGLLMIAALCGRGFLNEIQGPRKGIAVGAFLLIAQIASFLGGVINGGSPVTGLISATIGLSAVAGIAVMTGFILSAAWRDRFLKGLIISLVILLVCSLTGYFIHLERHIEIGGNHIYFEPIRLVLLWPTRFLTTGMGQLVWQHANIAGYFFALGFIFTVEAIHRQLQPQPRPWLKWTLATFLFTAVFLTGSRNAWVVLIACLPLLFIFRPPSFILKTVGVLALGFALGKGGLDVKKQLLESIPKPPPVPFAFTGDQHVSGLIKRGSMGRFSTYPAIWTDLENTRLLGKGLEETGKPFINMMHEHSIFLAAFRGGGFIALVALLAIIAISSWSAFGLFLAGTRWPLLFLTATVVHCLFDQSSIFRYNGKHLYLFFWVAVFIPLLIKPTPRPSSQDQAVP